MYSVSDKGRKKVLGLARCIKTVVAKAGKQKRDTRTWAERQSSCWDETRSEIQKERNIKKYYTRLGTRRQQSRWVNWSLQKVKIILIALFWINKSDMKGTPIGRSVSRNSILSENISASIALVWHVFLARPLGLFLCVLMNLSLKINSWVSHFHQCLSLTVKRIISPCFSDFLEKKSLVTWKGDSQMKNTYSPRSNSHSVLQYSLGTLNGDKQLSRSQVANLPTNGCTVPQG